MGKFRRESEKLPVDVRLQRRLALALDEAATQERLYDRANGEVEVQGLSPAEYALVKRWLERHRATDAALACCLGCGRVQAAGSFCAQCQGRQLLAESPSAPVGAPLH
ncbi:hypothetical protein RCF34_07400 [Pseudomonas sp. 102515]|uniref:hypothetical protein n=1 Tax=Pseudomonas sp. 102515 TaxID=3071568 RepID=UPI002802F766|nr:hypothetical protein [Pseudomonas sp. 102515]MDQ7912936.1 hypothetical protein [Pseudomonas sp. 102515]